MTEPDYEISFMYLNAYPPGEWLHEPDKVQYIIREGIQTFEVCIKRGMNGALLGYVGVSKSHPLFGQSYHGLRGLRVHGGLTYSGELECAQGRSEWAIKPSPHTTHPLHKGKVWWFGFHAGHDTDLVPTKALANGKYVTMEAMREECRRLAEYLSMPKRDYKFKEENEPPEPMVELLQFNWR